MPAAPRSIGTCRDRRSGSIWRQGNGHRRPLGKIRGEGNGETATAQQGRGTGRSPAADGSGGETVWPAVGAGGNPGALPADPQGGPGARSVRRTVQHAAGGAEIPRVHPGGADRRLPILNRLPRCRGQRGGKFGRQDRGGFHMVGERAVLAGRARRFRVRRRHVADPGRGVG